MLDFIIIYGAFVIVWDILVLMHFISKWTVKILKPTYIRKKYNGRLFYTLNK